MSGPVTFLNGVNTRLRGDKYHRYYLNRLETMYALCAMLDKQYEQAQEAKEAGQPIAWCMAKSFASPFLNAMDIVRQKVESTPSSLSISAASW